MLTDVQGVISKTVINGRPMTVVALGSALYWADEHGYLRTMFPLNEGETITSIGYYPTVTGGPASSDMGGLV